MIGSVLAWLADPANWTGSSGILIRLLEHLAYSFAAVAAAALIAVPLGLWIGHSGRLRWLVSAANASRAVPSLGLLFAVSLWLGPHLRGYTAFVVPSLIVLVLLALPPLLAGAYAGVEAIDPAARDAARGMGMRGGQVLREVELPCSLPLLLSGVRSAVLQVIATATIASYVSLGGLGRFLIDGQASRDYAQMAGGALLVAVLALVIDVLLGGLTRLVVSPGLSGAVSSRGAATSATSSGSDRAGSTATAAASTQKRDSA